MMEMGINKTNDANNMAIEIAGVKFKNPIFAASGTCGFGREYLPYYSLNEIGAITTKGMSITPREGNKAPRVAEAHGGMLNAVGLQNPGVEYFLEYELPHLKKYDVGIIANIFGNTVEECAEAAGMLAGSGVDIIELNISCPNVKEGGIVFGTEPKMAEEITLAVKKRAGNTPLSVKLSPNVTDIAKIARAVHDGGADAISMINTLIGMRIDIKTRRPILKNNTGGLSGGAIKPVAVRMIWQVSQAVGLPIIGMGGVLSGEDAAELMIAGASAVAVGTAAFDNPRAVIKIRDELGNYLMKNNTSASELTGSLEIW